MLETGSNYPYNSFEDTKPEYIIRPFDKLDVRIYTNDGFQLIDIETSGATSNQSSISNISYLVESDGMVKVPTLGRVMVSGMTIKEAEQFLEGKYTQYYQKPFVYINVTNRRVIVFSAGSTSGKVLTVENEKFTLLEALAQAGGIDDFGKAYRIKVLRGDLNDPKVFLFNISSIEEMKKSNMVLQANDVIYVEKRARYVNRTLNELAPYISLVNTVLLIVIATQNLK